MMIIIYLVRNLFSIGYSEPKETSSSVWLENDHAVC